jgi:hypothetical protein
MEHVSGATPQSLAHQQCLTAGVGADQQTMSVQPSAKRLFAGDKPIQPGRLLRYLIAGRCIQVQVASREPADAGTARDPFASGSLAPTPAT